VKKVMANFFFEGAGVDEASESLTNTVGSFRNANAPKTFEGIFEEACDNFKRAWKQDFRTAFTKGTSLENQNLVSSFKSDLLGPLQEDCNVLMESAGDDGDIGTVGSLYDQVSMLFDNKVDEYITEAANVGDLLPIKTVDFPLLVKSQVKESFNQVVAEEITPKLKVKKRIEHLIVYDRNDPSKTWEYPQCLYQDDFQDMMKAGKGVALSTEPQELPLYQWNIVEKLTDATTSLGKRVVIDLEIDKVVAQDGTVVTLPVPMKVNLADGAWVGGVINVKYKKAAETEGGEETEVVLQDILSGFTDWNTNTTTITSANTKDGVKAVIFNGQLSNEGNENALRPRYVQEDREWTIGEGCKVEASYTLEELQEHKALADMDLYQRSYNDIVMLISAMADKDGYNWLDELYAKYQGTELNPIDWNPVVIDTTFDCDSTTKTVALQSEYIAKELKFKIDRFLVDIADTVKLENLHFVIYGNPRFISLINPYVKWVFNAGQSLGGVKLDHSYGVMTTDNVKVYVVSSKLIDAKTHTGIRIIPFFDTGITFKRFKFSTDVITSKDTAYKDPTRPGGSMTYVFGVERYEDVALQAIQGNVNFVNYEDLIEVVGR
jgi:hypothetical protein